MHAGRMRLENKRSPVRIDQGLALSAFDLLASMVPTTPPASMVLTLLMITTVD